MLLTEMHNAVELNYFQKVRNDDKVFKNRILFEIGKAVTE